MTAVFFSGDNIGSRATLKSPHCVPTKNEAFKAKFNNQISQIKPHYPMILHQQTSSQKFNERNNTMYDIKYEKDSMILSHIL